MEIFLSEMMQRTNPDYHGSIGQGFGYVIQRRRDANGKIRYFGIRKSNTDVPPDGHLRFIITCAEIAAMGLHFADILVPRDEIARALAQTGRGALGSAIFYGHCGKDIYHADDIINLKNNWLK